MPTYARLRAGLVAVSLATAAAALPAPAEARAHARHHHAARVEALSLASRAAVVVDADANQVLYRRSDDAVRPVASLTKLMTALVVVEAGQPLDARIAITEEEAEATARSVSRLPVGTTLTRAELLHLALMASENRAAYALARNYPGGLAAAIGAMRRKAAALGMTQTRFVEPTGLSASNVSTSADVARLVRAASRVRLIREYSTSPSLIVKVRGGRSREFRNTDRLVRDPRWALRLQKTGYTEEAGRCLALQTVVAGRHVVIVLLDAPGPAARLADARRVRQWLERHVADGSLAGLGPLGGDESPRVAERRAGHPPRGIGEGAATRGTREAVVAADGVHAAARSLQ